MEHRFSGASLQYRGLCGGRWGLLFWLEKDDGAWWALEIASIYERSGAAPAATGPGPSPRALSQRRAADRGAKVSEETACICLAQEDPAQHHEGRVDCRSSAAQSMAVGQTQSDSALLAFDRLKGGWLAWHYQI